MDFDLSKWLTEIMWKKGLSDMNLAVRAGVSEKTIWGVRHGKWIPNLNSLLLILDALGKKIEIVDKGE